MKGLIRAITIFVLFDGTAYAGDWIKLHDFDKTDKQLFASVCILQIVDGLTTQSYLGNSPDNYIKDIWNWKYGTRRPSPELMWAVKTAELGGAYFVGKALPSKWRKGFFIAVDSLLLFCIQHNLKIGAGFAITF